MSISQFLQYANTAGVVSLLVVCLYGGLKGWWIFGYLYRELQNDRNEWKELAQTNMEIANKALQTLRDGGK